LPRLLRGARLCRSGRRLLGRARLAGLLRARTGLTLLGLLALRRLGGLLRRARLRGLRAAAGLPAFRAFRLRGALLGLRARRAAILLALLPLLAPRPLPLLLLRLRLRTALAGRLIFPPLLRPLRFGRLRLCQDRRRLRPGDLRGDGAAAERQSDPYAREQHVALANPVHVPPRESGIWRAHATQSCSDYGKRGDTAGSGRVARASRDDPHCRVRSNA
jgi:hypothetical protein